MPGISQSLCHEIKNALFCDILTTEQNKKQRNIDYKILSKAALNKGYRTVQTNKNQLTHEIHFTPALFKILVGICFALVHIFSVELSNYSI